MTVRQVVDPQPSGCSCRKGARCGACMERDGLTKAAQPSLRFGDATAAAFGERDLEGRHL